MYVAERANADTQRRHYWREGLLLDTEVVEKGDGKPRIICIATYAVACRIVALLNGDVTEALGRVTALSNG